VVTGLLLIQCVLAVGARPLWLISLLSLAGPFLIVWMVWDVLTDRRVACRELADDEEWGYADRPDLRPGR
jgi:threonine/homoserine/homoserine lactone efflux protein